jgi:hypothetical protein
MDRRVVLVTPLEGGCVMRTVVVIEDAHRVVVRELTEHGVILCVATTIHEAVAFQQAYTNGRY